jgi:hypothetical protein
MKQIKSKPLTEKIKDLIISFWRGDLSLAVSYWFFYNLGPTLVIILIESFTKPESNLEFFLYSIVGIYFYFFASIGTWRSAGVYIKTNKPPFWGYLMRVIIVVLYFPLLALLLAAIKLSFVWIGN